MTGSTHDSVCWAMSDLAEAVESSAWPSQYWIAGDAAYPTSERVITPYPGKALREIEDSFNFYQSRLRINIECTFGILWKRFLILQSPLTFSLPFVSDIVQVLCKIHNLIINERISEVEWPEAPAPAVTQGTVADNIVGARSDLQTSCRRDDLAKRLHECAMVRP
jgi:hypothetical protein